MGCEFESHWMHKLIVMTIKELYYFAINHSLLDKEVDEVIRVYSSEQSKVIQPAKALDLNKVEYTFDDLIALFSNWFSGYLAVE